MSLLTASVGFLDSPYPKVLPTLGIIASLQAVGMVDPTLRENRDLDRGAEFNVSNDTISATMLTSTSGIGPETELSK
jgi:hypothetical protein